MVEHSRPVVRRSTGTDRSAVARVLAASFADDPVLTHLFPVSIRYRASRLRRFFRLEAARSRRRGGCWVTDDGTAASVWSPPGRWASTRWEDATQGPGAMVALGRQLGRAQRARTDMETPHRELPDHWYLLYVGVDPARQGRGLGSEVMRPVLEECDRTGTPAYLEATCERNRALYLRHGFTDRGILPLPDGGPTMFRMWRDPA
jgi:GNAT superfamily N-acetyltransferase